MRRKCRIIAHTNRIAKIVLQIKAFDAVARKNMGEKNNTAPNLYQGGAVKSDEADLAFYIFGEDLV